ncbi:MAG: RNA-binding transcriptional accessory protein [Lachnospiraceae bacterium]|nr:RNA-binding transcriptional accessory protein [Lachnospiraceae bacterium]
MDIIAQLAKELSIKTTQVKAAVDLIDEGNTIPFIARYRKEATGALNDEILRNLDERLKYLRNLEEKKTQVLDTIREQGNLTPELEKQILEAATMVAVEDLYRPFRPKRRTRAMVAKEKGLEPLAMKLLAQDLQRSALKEAAVCINPEKEVNTAEEALQGAMDILAELFSDNAEYRTYIRDLTRREGHLTSSTKDDTVTTVYEMYYHYDEPLPRVARHRVLALNRGEAEKVLSVKITAPEEQIISYLEKKIIKGSNEYSAAVLRDAIADSYQRLMGPSIERELRNDLTETAEDGAIEVFGKNLRQLLMQPPITGQVVLGWDPAFRTGCKLAVVDATGKVLDTVVVYPTAPQNRVEEAKRVVKALIRKYHVTLISLGNGTASRESEQIISEMLHEIGGGVSYAIVSEAGASVYSASKLATEEFPQFDVGQRSSASIARRLQDPLAELVKIDPKAIGVGQYQHDMNQKKLDESLRIVVEDAVNQVGVDVNTASAPLLEYVSGISKTVAKNIVSYREANGAFRDRRELLKVEKLGPKAFEQCAGFLRIRGGKDPLDMSAVHPESYTAAKKLMKELGYEPKDLLKGGLKGIRAQVKDVPAMAASLDIGEITLKDILEELEKPSRDPREEMPKPVLRTDVLAMEDLQPGMILKGTVRNIVDFGAFVDIGVHHDGLVHISQMARRRIQHPLEVVSVGDVVEVQVMSVELNKKRIQLTMKVEK